MISVVVCTRNRASNLERCLHHLRAMTHDPNLVWQLIVVDNGSEDGTRVVVEQYAKSLPITYVYEGKRGLSHARNRGIATSRNPIIAFTDDDCLVRKDWLTSIYKAFALDARLSVLGGKVERAHAADHPLATRLHDQTQEIRTLQQIMALMIGCNMSFRRDVLEAVGLFDATLGKGTPIGSAEDIDLLYRALLYGSRITYSRDVVVYHDHGRSTPSSIEEVTRDYVRCRGAFYWKFMSHREVLRLAYWEVRRLLKHCVRPSDDSRTALRMLAAGALYKCFGARLATGAARVTNRFVT